jgi:predicted dehydrogenase
MKSKSRREFLSVSLGTAAAVAASRGRALSAADRVPVGVMGLGGRGTGLVRDLARRDDVDVAWICDVDEARLERSLGVLDSAGRPAPKRTQDFRKILDDPAVDALVVATNHHWHALPTILACQAGKDVYVEKPCSHNTWEGRQMIAAARKYERVVQVGLQNRSAAYLEGAREFFQSGKLGDLHLVRVLNMNEGRMRPKGPEQPVPATLDWDMWCGPGPVVPYSPGSWFIARYDYSLGSVFDDAVHQLDVMRLVTGLGSPQTVVAAGGVYHFKDGRDTPDTMLATFEYPELTLVFQTTMWAQYIRETPSVIRDGDEFPNWLFNGTKIELFGTEGMMLVGRQGGGWQAFDNDRNEIASSYGRSGAAHEAHMANFLECVRSRERPNAHIEDTFPSTLYAHLANASYRSGHRKLDYDDETGWIRDDPEANAFMKRKGREPWAIPGEV